MKILGAVPLLADHTERPVGNKMPHIGALRRSLRIRRPPVRYGDRVNLKTLVDH